MAVAGLAGGLVLGLVRRLVHRLAVCFAGGLVVGVAILVGRLREGIILLCAFFLSLHSFCVLLDSKVFHTFNKHPFQIAVGYIANAAAPYAHRFIFRRAE